MSRDLKYIEMLIGGDMYNLSLKDIDKFREAFGGFN
jgi:hypothetical protein